MANTATPVRQPEDDDMPTSKPTTSLANSLKLFPPNQTACFLFCLLATFAISVLVFLTVPNCEGSLSLKAWGIEYQLTKKGSCTASPETSQK